MNLQLFGGRGSSAVVNGTGGAVGGRNRRRSEYYDRMSPEDQERDDRRVRALEMYDRGELAQDTLGQLATDWSNDTLQNAVNRDWITRDQANQIAGQNIIRFVHKTANDLSRQLETERNIVERALANSGNDRAVIRSFNSELRELEQKINAAARPIQRSGTALISKSERQQLLRQLDRIRDRLK